MPRILSLAAFCFSLLSVVMAAAQSVPGAADFQKVTLVSNLQNAVDFEFAPDGRIFILDRGGEIKIYKPNIQATVSAGSLSVFSGLEDGLIGIAFDPSFAVNNFLYLHYSPQSQSVNRVSRFHMNGDTLDLGSEVIVLEWPTQRVSCCHAAGDLEFDTAGNLYIATGDNAQHGAYSALDENNPNNSAEKSSANTMDLRGKILRIKPNPDGTYAIPNGNLFPGGNGGLPEIYVMGCRNPYKMFIDPVTNWLLWGDVGPDASQAGVDGPQGTDELNLTMVAGNSGWPHFIGDNQPYRNTYLNYYFDPAAPTNDSQWNTGPVVLPAAQPALLSFFHKCYLPGPLYRFDSAVQSVGKLPSQFDGLWFYFDFNTSKIFIAQLDAQGNVTNTPFHWAGSVVTGSGFLDVKLGPDHHLYVLEYGVGCCQSNVASGKLTRYDYTGVVPNQLPVPALSAEPAAGPVPLTVMFSSVGSFDPDGNPFSIEWDFDTDGVIDSTAPNPTFTYTTPGDFNAQLRLTDDQGGLGVANVTIYSGNNFPVVLINSPPDGGLIEWNHTVEYVAAATDAEDGSTDAGTIPCSAVTVTPSLGHLEHAHDGSPQQGCNGSFDLVHTHDVEGLEDLFWAINATYTDNNGLKSFEQIKLHPKRKEAEFFDSANAVQILPNSDSLSGGLFAVRALTVGSYIEFEGRNLQGIDGVLYRVASDSAGGTIELRLGSPTGPVLSVATVPDTGGTNQWSDLLVPLTNPGGKHDLYFLFQGSVGATNLFDLNYVEFQGAGVSTDTLPPYLLFVDMVAPTSLVVRFSETVTNATAGSAASYVLNPSVNVTGAVLQADGRTVELTTAPLPDDVPITVTATGITDLVGLTATTQITYVPFSQTESIVRINAGGPQTTAAGETWMADTYFTGGQSYPFTIPVAGTTDDVLYQSERAGSCSYQIPVPEAGQYDVHLHFAEMFFGVPGGGIGAPGMRVFTVNVEGGQGTLNNYDIFDDVGAATAVVKEFNGISVQDGFVSVVLTTNVDNAKISALEVFKPGVVPSAPAPPSIAITSPNNGATVNADLTVSFFVANADPHVRLDVDGVEVGHTNNGSAFSVTGLAPGPHTLRVTLQNPDETLTRYFDEVTVMVPVPAAPDTLIRLNAGGPELNTGGQTWDADMYFSGGSTFSNPTPISGTTDDVLYQTERFGDFSYEIPVPAAGEYDLVLHFAEIFWGAPGGAGGQRVFEVSIEGGQASLNSFNIVDLVGPVAATVQLFEDILVVDGTLTVQFTGTIDGAKLSALEIFGGTNNPMPLPPEISIVAPIDGSSVQPPFSVAFAVSNWTVAPGSSHLHYSVDGVPQGSHMTLAPIPIDFLSPGQHTIRLELAEANHTLTGIFDEITVDVPVIPSVTILAPADGADVMVPFDVSFALSNWTEQVRLDIDGLEVELTDSSDPFTVTALAAGAHVLRVTLVDAAGVATQTFDEINISVIAPPPPTPTISILTPVGSSQVTPPFEVTFAVQNWVVEATGTHVRLLIDDSVVMSHFSLDPLTIATLSPGPHSVALELVNADMTGTGIIDSVNIIVPMPAGATTPLAFVNCGGPEVTIGGDTWMADTYFTGGSTLTAPNPIADTALDVLYHSERFGDATYDIPVGSNVDLVDVFLHFAEIYWGAPGGGPGGVGQRVFNVSIENGQASLIDYDPTQSVGAVTADVQQFTNISVQDGAVTIVLTGVVDNAKISAIEVRVGVPPVQYRRGDFSDDGSVDLLDVVAMLDYLFVGGSAAACPDAADFNGDGAHVLDDVAGLLNYLFNSGAPPPAPGPINCGVGPETSLGLCATNSCP
ncbi:MAG: malectin domain-containing carbohydrate-binding protein [Planctomycetota bacterium]